MSGRREYPFLRVGSDDLGDAIAYATKRDACEAFKRVARELGQYDQEIDGAIHYARNKNELNEYPDFILSLGTRGGLRIVRA